MTAAGEEQKPQTSLTFPLGEPAWSLDSKEILFWSEKGGNADLYRINLEKEDETLEQVTKTSCNNKEPSWGR